MGITTEIEMLKNKRKQQKTQILEVKGKTAATADRNRRAASGMESKAGTVTYSHMESGEINEYDQKLVQNM